MLTIRLTRKGKKNQPFFRVVLVDKRRSSKGGRNVEELGFVDPLKKRKSFEKERILYWISKGAQPSDTVHNLLVNEKIIDAKKKNNVKIKKSAEVIKAEEEAKKAVAAPKAKTPEVLVAPAVEVTIAPVVETPASTESSGEAKPAV